MVSNSSKNIKKIVYDASFKKLKKKILMIQGHLCIELDILTIQFFVYIDLFHATFLFELLQEQIHQLERNVVISLW